MAKKTDNTQENLADKLIVKPMDDVLHESMLPYAEHVILERAIPRAEDGLKPVQRRILYAMNELSMTPDKPYRKCARIVGDCLGKYHPHGDSSVYEALVRMAQDFNMGAILVDGHGNFGSIDGDSAAAMRYTEARMAPLALELLKDLDKDTVDFTLNFDDSLKEPTILPCKFPNLLVNGATGIAVGLATSIPTHNLGESIDASIAYMDNPSITLEELMKLIPCPDFPTGGYILSSSDAVECYTTGRGRIFMRAKTHIEPQKNGKSLIVITELPYQLNKARVLEKILSLSQEKKAIFAGISDIRDESDKSGMRAVIEVRKDYDPQKLLNALFKYSDLQCTFSVNMVAIENGRPKQMSLIDILHAYISFQEQVVSRRTLFDLDRAKNRGHILDGLVIALLNLDEVIKLIRASKTPKIAKEGLIERFSLSELQAQSILDLRLQRLTNLEQLAIEREQEEIRLLIDELNSILASEDKLKNVIREELLEIRSKYGVPRRTKIIDGDANIIIEELEAEPVDEVVVLLYKNARLKRIPKKQLEKETFDERPLYIINTRTDKRLRLFTNKGSSIMLPICDIAEQKPNTKSIALNSLVPIDDGEDIVSVFVEAQDESGDYVFYTKKGFVKRTAIKEYKSRTKKLAAINIKNDDALLSVEPLREGTTIMLISSAGYAIRFSSDLIPDMGRVSGGVRCIKLDPFDEVVLGTQITEDEGEILVISNKGYGKRSLMFDYEVQGRNGRGLKTIDFRKNGSNGTKLVAAFYVRESFTMELFMLHSQSVEIATEDVKIFNRANVGQLLAMCVLDEAVTSVCIKSPVVI